MYLDQWVWIRLARANVGRPQHNEDQRVLDAIRTTAAKGVHFPLSATHYEETARILDWRQRKDLTDVVAPISLMQTIRSQPVLMRHQFLAALHETLGRPAFRPPRPKVLGVGVHWAFSGVQAFFKVVNDEGQVIDVDRTRLRHLNEYAEAAVFTGPLPDDLPGLFDLGYVAPRDLENRPGSRVEYEQWLSEQLADRSPDADELRALVMAREIYHEYTDLLNNIFAEYRLTLSMITGGRTGMASRAKAVAFMERVPTARISAHRKRCSSGTRDGTVLGTCFEISTHSALPSPTVTSSSPTRMRSIFYAAPAPAHGTTPALSQSSTAFLSSLMTSHRA